MNLDVPISRRIERCIQCDSILTGRELIMCQGCLDAIKKDRRKLNEIRRAIELQYQNKDYYDQKH